MGFLGGAIKITGKVVGKTAEFSIRTVGKTISIGVKCAHKPKIAEKSDKVSKGLGKVMCKTAELSGNELGIAMDKVVEYGSKAGGSIGKYIAETKGADEDQIKRAKIIGNIIGGGTVGLCLGDLVGTALTGTSASSALHGLVAAKIAVAGGIDGAKNKK